MKNVIEANLSFNASRNEIGYIDNGNNENAALWHTYDWNDHWHWYPQSYPVYINQEDKVSRAFKIVKKLMEQGFIRNISVQKFIKVVNVITDVL